MVTAPTDNARPRELDRPDPPPPGHPRHWRSRPFEHFIAVGERGDALTLCAHHRPRDRRPARDRADRGRVHAPRSTPTPSSTRRRCATRSVAQHARHMDRLRRGDVASRPSSNSTEVLGGVRPRRLRHRARVGDGRRRHASSRSRSSIASDFVRDGTAPGAAVRLRVLRDLASIRTSRSRASTLSTAASSMRSRTSAAAARWAAAGTRTARC